jgi:hypothetical protein
MEPDLPQRRQGAKVFHSWSLSRSLIMGISSFQWFQSFQRYWRLASFITGNGPFQRFEPFQTACPEFYRRVPPLRFVHGVSG